MTGCEGIEEQSNSGDGNELAGSVRLIVALADPTEFLERLGDRSWEIIERDPDAWVESWKPWAEAVDLGSVVLLPPWQEPPASRQSVLTIDPGRSWGHGAHPSTRLLAGWLVAMAPTNDSVADVGCGSGVLTVVAAFLGATSVAAVDVDPEAVDAASGNVEANRGRMAGTAISIQLGSTACVEGETFDLVMANIDAPVLELLADELVALVASDGELWLSGMLSERAASLTDRVHEAYALAGRSQPGIELSELEGWAAIRFF